MKTVLLALAIIAGPLLAREVLAQDVDPDTLTSEGIIVLPEPQRVLDTRKTGREPGPVRFVVPGRPWWPNVALVNITITEAQAPGYGVAYDCGELPDTSNVNFAPGRDDSNTAFVRLSPAGELCIYTSAHADVVIDLQGWTGTAGLFELP